MKQLKFNVGEILPALLDKSKVTTIRKAWKNDNIQPDLVRNIFKPCKYEVGEIVEVVWTGDLGLLRDSYLKLGYTPHAIIDDVLGKVKITKIEKIEIIYSTNMFMTLMRIGKNHYEDRCLEPIAKSEGFKSPEAMFNYLEKYADGLGVAKPFWLISFIWLNNSDGEK